MYRLSQRLIRVSGPGRRLDNVLPCAYDVVQKTRCICFPRPAARSRNWYAKSSNGTWSFCSSAVPYPVSTTLLCATSLLGLSTSGRFHGTYLVGDVISGTCTVLVNMLCTFLIAGRLWYARLLCKRLDCSADLGKLVYQGTWVNNRWQLKGEVSTVQLAAFCSTAGLCMPLLS